MNLNDFDPKSDELFGLKENFNFLLTLLKIIVCLK